MNAADPIWPSTHQGEPASFKLRPMQLSDMPFLEEMLYEAAGGAYTPGFAEILPRDQLPTSGLYARYLGAWGRRSDERVRYLPLV